MRINIKSVVEDEFVVVGDNDCLIFDADRKGSTRFKFK
jgi:hypothetical protein